jgi:hypothetical protein
MQAPDYFFTGTVTLSPMVVAPVCRVGDQLQLTCTASAQFIRWSIHQVNDQGTLEEATTSVHINFLDDNQISLGVVNSSMFTFTRTSTPRVLPLISTLSIDSVSIGLNGAVVRCSDAANPTTLASTTIYIVDIGEYILFNNCVHATYTDIMIYRSATVCSNVTYF